MATDPPLANESFWAFSLEVYARPNVSDACIMLQDSFGCDVNILLFCCWAAAIDAERLDENAIQSAIDSVYVLQSDIIQPLRSARRRLKGGFDGSGSASLDGLHTEVSACELRAERGEQQILERLITRGSASPPPRKRARQLAEGNIGEYFAMLEITAGAARDAASLIITNSFPDGGASKR